MGESMFWSSTPNLDRLIPCTPPIWQYWKPYPAAPPCPLVKIPNASLLGGTEFILIQAATLKGAASSSRAPTSPIPT